MVAYSSDLSGSSSHDGSARGMDTADCKDLSGSSTSHTSTSTRSGSSETVVKKSVTFAPTAKVRQFFKLSKDQATEYWYKPEDLQEMKRSFQRTIECMTNATIREGENLGEEHCTRGLEYRTRAGAKQRMKNKFNGMAAVLHEQDRQNYEGRQDYQALAKAYQSANFHCIAEARALGEQDALDIQDYISTNNYPSFDIKLSSSSSPPSNNASRRLGALSSSGSFHKRGFRGIRRMLSGNSKSLRKVQDTTAVPVQ